MYRVMIADDEAIVRKGLIGLINWPALDCEIVYQASDGIEVLENLPFCKPDILICDIRMPKTDGISVAKYIYDNKLDTKVIILTAYADFSYASAAIKYNVVDYVTKANVLEDIGEAVRRAQQALRMKSAGADSESQHNQRQNTLLAILNGTLSPSDMDSMAAQNGLELERYLFIFVHFLSAGGPERREDTEGGNFIRTVAGFADKAFAGYRFYRIPLNSSQFGIILHHLAPGPEKEIFRICKELSATLRGFLDTKVSMGISDPVQELNSLSNAFAQAEYYSNNFFLDQGSTVYGSFNNTGERYGNVTKESMALMDQLSFELQKGHREEVSKLYQQIMALYAGYSMQQIKSTGVLLLNYCDRILSNYNSDTATLLQNSHLLSDLLETPLLETFNTILENVFRKTMDFLSQSVQSKNKLIVEAAAYIEAHYCESISPLDIAEALHVNGSYLSRIFREQTGSTIIASINGKKIDKAKELLSQNNLKVYEVAEQIGISDTTYFSHFFKKYTGLTPREFRDNAVI